MPSILRSRAALFVLMGAFLIPIATSSLRGITHVLTCAEEVRAPFTVIIGDSGDQTAVSSQPPLIRGEEEDTVTVEEGAQPAEGLCGGLFVNPAATFEGDRIAMVFGIDNQTEHTWQGTVRLRLGDTEVPIGIGELGPGESASETVPLNLDPGSVEITGALLIGP